MILASLTFLLFIAIGFQTSLAQNQDTINSITYSEHSISTQSSNGHGLDNETTFNSNHELLASYNPITFSSENPEPLATSNVNIVDFAFNPPDLTIKVGDTVTWTNMGGFSHTSTSDTGVWDSGILNPGQSFSHTFDSVGEFSYQCRFHPSMTGIIRVQSCVIDADCNDGITCTDDRCVSGVCQNPLRLLEQHVVTDYSVHQAIVAMVLVLV